MNKVTDTNKLTDIILLYQAKKLACKQKLQMLMIKKLFLFHEYFHDTVDLYRISLW